MGRAGVGISALARGLAAASPDSGTVLVLTRTAPLPAATPSSSPHCFRVSFCDDLDHASLPSFCFFRSR